MKKNLVRIVALLLVAMLALTLIPLGAFATEPRDGKKASVHGHVYDKSNLNLYNFGSHMIDYTGMSEYDTGKTIKTSDFDSYKIIDGKRYDFAGFNSINKTYATADKKINEYLNKNQPDLDNPDEAKKFYDYIDSLYKDIDLVFTNKNIKVEAFPVQGNKTDEEYEKLKNEWFNKYGVILAGYLPHSHKLSYWISDGTTHWRNCLVCDEQFIYQTWCQDGDEDEVCNICGGHVPYHDVKVIESEGGKITVNRDTASHRMKITADVEPAAGYKLEKLHFFKIREDGSRQEITRRKKDGQFYTTMPTYELEVSAEFVKN